MKAEHFMYVILSALILSSVLTVVVTRYIEAGKGRDDIRDKTIWRWNPIYTIQILVRNGGLTIKEKILLYIPLCIFIGAIVLAIIYKNRL